MRSCNCCQMHPIKCHLGKRDNLFLFIWPQFFCHAEESFGERMRMSFLSNPWLTPITHTATLTRKATHAHSHTYSKRHLLTFSHMQTNTRAHTHTNTWTFTHVVHTLTHLKILIVMTEAKLNKKSIWDVLMLLGIHHQIVSHKKAYKLGSILHIKPFAIFLGKGWG